MIRSFQAFALTLLLVCLPLTAHADAGRYIGEPKGLLTMGAGLCLFALYVRREGRKLSRAGNVLDARHLFTEEKHTPPVEQPDRRAA